MQTAPANASDFDQRLTACPFCGSDRISLFDTDFRGRTIDRCSICGVMFLNPQYSDSYLTDFYSHYIGPETGETSAEENRARCMIHEHYITLIEGHATPCVGADLQSGPPTTKGKFLSVGCGDGLELSIAKDRGWEVEGFDVDEKVTTALSQKLGVTVRNGDFLTMDYPKDHFDCIYLHQVLEHPKNPQEYLKKIHEILKPGGILFIGSPNVHSFANRLKTLSGRLRLKKNRGKHYDTWHHLFFYSPRIMGRILQDHYGYRVKHTENGFGDRARLYSPAKIKRMIVRNRYLPFCEVVFITLATKD